MPRLYSKWNYSTKEYDYYQAQGDLRAGVFAEDAPRRLTTSLGLSPEEAARDLPLGARRVGSGKVAQGMVASPDRHLDLRTVAKVGIGIVLGVFAWKKLR